MSKSLPLIPGVTVRDMVDSAGFTVLAALAETIWTEYYTPIIGEAQVRYMLECFQSAGAIARQVFENGYNYSAAFVGVKSVAYIATCLDAAESRVFLSKLYVIKSYRGKGIAKALLGYHLSKFTADEVWLTVNKGNMSSIAAYKRMGFKVIDEAVTDIGGGFVMDDYIMGMSMTGSRMK